MISEPLKGFGKCGHASYLDLEMEGTRDDEWSGFPRMSVGFEEVHDFGSNVDAAFRIARFGTGIRSGANPDVATC
ncbi:hypothetical protein [Roseimicrobium gellanilyticum]|uniref:hypothetical protein n=1 Tax=Roseimicrobium gellanilyticum TaxID=748857 RepID=UPI001B85BDDF|nr:hypothetical protein [Roseimicrobium gellanilyticum]